MKKIIIEKLAAGEVIESYREAGNSMTPKIKSRQPVTLARPDHSKLEAGDIVFCKVSGNYYTHLVTGVKPNQVQISNNHGHVNGWTTFDKVFGIVTHIDGVEVSGALNKIKKEDSNGKDHD